MKDTRMQLWTGGWLDTANPRPEDIQIEDIAHSLSLTCRYGGHCKVFYSVAEHCVAVSRVVPREHQLWGLLHDAAEAYVRDIPSPLKPLLPGYEEVENKVMRAICIRFGLPLEMPSIIRVADKRVLMAEQPIFMGKQVFDWGYREEPAEVDLLGLDHILAEKVFLKRFKEVNR